MNIPECMRETFVLEGHQNSLQTQEALRNDMSANTVDSLPPEFYLRNHYKEQDIRANHENYSFTYDDSAFNVELNYNCGSYVAEDIENWHDFNSCSDIQENYSGKEINWIQDLNFPNYNNERWLRNIQFHPSTQDCPYLGLPQPEQPNLNEDVNQDEIQPKEENKKGPGRQRICKGFDQKKAQQSRTVFRAFCRVLKKENTRKLLRQKFNDEDKFDQLIQHIMKGNNKNYEGKKLKKSEIVNLTLTVYKVTHATEIDSKHEFLEFAKFGKLFLLAFIPNISHIYRTRNVLVSVLKAETYTRDELKLVKLKKKENQDVQRQEIIKVFEYCLEHAENN